MTACHNQFDIVPDGPGIIDGSKICVIENGCIVNSKEYSANKMFPIYLSPSGGEVSVRIFQACEETDSLVFKCKRSTSSFVSFSFIEDSDIASQYGRFPHHKDEHRQVFGKYADLGFIVEENITGGNRYSLIHITTNMDNAWCYLVFIQSGEQ